VSNVDNCSIWRGVSNVADVDSGIGGTQVSTAIIRIPIEVDGQSEFCSFKNFRNEKLPYLVRPIAVEHAANGGLCFTGSGEHVKLGSGLSDCVYIASEKGGVLGKRFVVSAISVNLRRR
jgi:hypothetical protein